MPYTDHDRKQTVAGRRMQWSDVIHVFREAAHNRPIITMVVFGRQLIISERERIPIERKPKSAIMCAIFWCAAIGAFAISKNYFLSLRLNLSRTKELKTGGLLLKILHGEPRPKDISFTQLSNTLLLNLGCQFPKGAGNIKPRHFLAPRHGEIGVVERLGWLICGLGGLTYDVFREFLSGNHFLRRHRLYRMRADAAQDDF
jgi:hypothetical protein